MQAKVISNCVWADRKRALAAQDQEKNNIVNSKKHGADLRRAFHFVVMEIKELFDDISF